jgi:hypothetical protein
MTAFAVAHPPLVRIARAAARLTAAACAACWLAAAPVVGLAADKPPAARSRVSDPAVRPAGGGHCASCGPGGCRQPHGKHHGHHTGCRDGVCVPYCPVRPQQFGFYGTQWRRWPGSEVVQVAGTRDAGPVSPPRSAVPGPSEESLNPEAEQEPAADAGAEAGRGAAPAASPREPLPEPAVPPNPATEPTAPKVLDPVPEMRREPPAEPMPDLKPDPKPDPASEPNSVPQPNLVPDTNLVPEPAAAPKPESPLPPAEPKPLPTEPSTPVPEAKPRPEDENLFEAVSGVGSGPGWRAQRRFAVGAAAADAPTKRGVGRIEPATHIEEPSPSSVPRVSFDPAAEKRRLRSTR